VENLRRIASRARCRACAPAETRAKVKAEIAVVLAELGDTAAMITWPTPSTSAPPATRPRGRLGQREDRPGAGRPGRKGATPQLLKLSSDSSNYVKFEC